MRVDQRLSLMTLSLSILIVLVWSCSDQANTSANTSANISANTSANTSIAQIEMDHRAHLILIDPHQNMVEFKALPEAEPAQVVENTVQEIGQIPIEPTPWNPLAFSRTRKRMDIDQLSRAFEQFNGNLGWHTNGAKDRWREQWASLGGPNFLTRVNEDLRPSVLFTKVIRDAAIEVCVPLVDLELSSSAPILAQRHLVFVADPLQMPADQEEFRTALSKLLRSAHGIDLSIDDPEIDQWLTLLVEISQRESIAEAWRALCIATLIHPRFWSY